MKRVIKVASPFIIALFTVSAVFAGETGHYTNGVEGIKGATLPGPGFYYKMYNVMYKTDRMMDDKGKKSETLKPDITVIANVHRFIFGTGIKFLGADVLADVTVPLIYTDFKMEVVPMSMVMEDDQFAIGDIAFEPVVLSWHGGRYDFAAGAAFYAPTGKYDEEKQASPGKDMWTMMLTAGGTLYLDSEKEWNASILARYEKHTEKEEKKIRPGDEFHFEWGAGKTFMKIIDAGLAGYCHWQLTDDSGDGTAGYDKSVHDRIFAAGPELGVFIPPAMLAINIRGLWEFGAVDRTEGFTGTLVLTKIF